MNKYSRYLLFLMLFLICSNLLWYYLGHKPLHWDSADHLSYSLETYKSLSHSSLFHSLFEVSWYYPPFVYWTSLPFQMIFGKGGFAGYLQITFFLLLLVWTVFHITKKLYNEPAGLFAAFCIGMFPIINEYARDYMLDLPLAAMISLAVLFLIRTKDFSDTVQSSVLGLVLGLGMLTKWTFILFLITPLVYYFSEGWQFAPKKSKVILNFLLSAVIALIVSLLWYLRSIIPIFSNRLNELERGDLSFFGNLFYYFKIIPEQISLILLILFAVAIFLFAAKSNFLHRRMPLYWLTGSYVLITIISFKLPRFSIALLIPVSILFSGIVFYGENEPRKQGRFVKIFAGIALINFIIMSFINPQINFALPFTETPLINNISPNRINWQGNEVIKIIEGERLAEKKSKVNLRVLAAEENFNTSVLRYYTNLNNAQINILGGEGSPLFTDFIVLLNKPIKVNDLSSETEVAGKLFSGNYSNTFKEFKKFDLPYGAQIVLYKVKQGEYSDLHLDSLKQTIEKSAGKFFIKYLKSGKNLKYEIIFGDSLAAVGGKIKSLRISAAEVKINKLLLRGLQYINDYKETESNDGIPVKKFELELRGLEYSMESLLYSDKFEILSLDELKINSLELSPADIKFYMESSSKNKVSVNNISFTDNFINIEGHSSGYNLDFEIALSISQLPGSNVLFKIEKCMLGGITVPSVIADYMLGFFNPLIKGAESVNTFKLGRLAMEENKIVIK